MTTLERAGIEFAFSFYDDGDERGPRTGFELDSTKLVDAAAFTAETDLPPTDANVRAYVDLHANEYGEEAIEALAFADPEGDDDDDSSSWDERDEARGYV